MNKPFDGGISRYYSEAAPEEVRRAIQEARKGRILSKSYPYEKR